MKNLFKLLLLTCVTSTLAAADGSAEAAAASASTTAAIPTYDTDLERSVSPASRPYVGTVRQLELDAKHKHDISAAEAVEAIYWTLPSAARSAADEDVEVLGTDLAKKVLLEKHLARAVTPLIGSSKHCLTPRACGALLTYLAPKKPVTGELATRKARLAAGIERWCPKSTVVAEVVSNSGSYDYLSESEKRERARELKYTNHPYIEH